MIVSARRCATRTDRVASTAALRSALADRPAGDLRTVFGARAKSRATGLIFSPSRRQRRRMVSQVSMLITPWGRSSRGTVSLPVPSGGRPALRAQGYIFRAPSEVQISAAVSTCSHSVVRPQLRAGRNRRAISLPVGLGPTSVDRASRHPMGQPTPASAGEHRCPESYAVVPYVNALRVEFDERHPIESGYREGRVATECDIFYRAIVLKHVSGSGHRCC